MNLFNKEGFNKEFFHEAQITEIQRQSQCHSFHYMYTSSDGSVANSEIRKLAKRERRD